MDWAEEDYLDQVASDDLSRSFEGLSSKNEERTTTSRLSMAENDAIFNSLLSENKKYSPKSATSKFSEARLTTSSDESEKPSPPFQDSSSQRTKDSSSHPIQDSSSQRAKDSSSKPKQVSSSQPAQDSDSATTQESQGSFASSQSSQGSFIASQSSQGTASQSTMYTCQFCKRKLKTEKGLVTHLENCRKSDKNQGKEFSSFPCQNCGKKLNSEKGYKAHLTKCTSAETREQDKKSFACDICGKVLPSEKGLKSHHTRIHVQRKKKAEEELNNVVAKKPKL